MLKNYLIFIYIMTQISTTNKLLFLDNNTNVEIGITATHIDANFKHNTAGYIILAFGKKNRTQICPGDFVFVSYDKTPIIEDMHCFEKFEESVPDREIGGHNDWYVDKVTKYSQGGFMVKAKRRLRTRDKFDDWFKSEPEIVLFAISDGSYEFGDAPSKTGVRSLMKFQNYM